MTPKTKKGDLLADAAARGARYVGEIGDRRVAPLPEDVARLEELGGSLNEAPCDPAEVIAQLDEIGSPATVASTGGRYFGFVTGGALPAAMAANWLAGAWDQNAALVSQSPVAAKLEEIAAGWLLDLLGLPPKSAVGFVTCCTAANFTALAAARHALLARAGWNVEDRGLFGAPEIKVVVGAEVHVSLLKALAMLGFGRTRVTRVPVDGQGRMRADALPELDERTLVCIQAGNVNTGAFDPAEEICNRAHEGRAWVHVDGAFGLWAAAAPERAHLAAGFADADSWATDGHKWLNVPYDSGLAFVREAQHLPAAMSGTSGSARAAYLIQGDQREPWQFTPEGSRRARGVEIWAALRSLGRRGLAEMIERNCKQAGRFAEGLRAAGFAILNDVVLNQVLVSFGDAETTRRVIREIQAEGTCWCGGTEWQGKAAMRISVSSWATTDEDVERSIEAIRRIAEAT
jgi:glutamate/tyrosine decarboxylase-like PLP-dependent enzyme